VTVPVAARRPPEGSREIFKEFVDIFIRRWDDRSESADEREMRRGRYSGSRRQGDLHG
jgi:hypothetical protein